MQMRFTARCCRFRFCHVRVIHIVRVLTRVGQDVGVGRSIRASKSLEDD